MNKWKQNLIAVGLDPKKELFTLGVFSLGMLALTVALYFLMGVSFYLVLPLLIWVIGSYFLLNRYRGVRNRKQGQWMEEFVRLFTFFGVYIQDGYNVYNALEAIVDFASLDVKKMLVTLLNRIESDKSVEPYVEFASNFPDISVRQVMLSIYQMVDEGQGGIYVRQFERLFAKLSEQKHQLEKEKWRDRLGTLSVLPLAGSGIAMISLSLSLMKIMEGSLYGL